ncbi:MAG TPA: hypothetical protein VGG17_11375 [Acidimicrobiales bacterium]
MQTSYGYAFFTPEVTNVLITFDHYVIDAVSLQWAHSNTLDTRPADQAHPERTLLEKGAIL